MTRRSALTALGIVVAAHVGQREGQSSVSFTPWPKGNIQLDLDTYTAYVFTEGGRTVTVTPKELMDALKGEDQ